NDAKKRLRALEDAKSRF
ncbi:hypothetical protein EE612_030389, partial [Oryza sativa]